MTNNHRAPATYDNISDNMREIVDAIHAEGFDVYMRQARDTWAYFTDGKRIGYVQFDRMSGLNISTAHVPNRQSGTGFRVDRRTNGPITRQDMEDAFAFCPAWARADERASVVKWRDWDHFHNHDGFSRDYVKIEKPAPVVGSDD